MLDGYILQIKTFEFQSLSRPKYRLLFQILTLGSDTDEWSINYTDCMQEFQQGLCFDKRSPLTGLSVIDIISCATVHIFLLASDS